MNERKCQNCGATVQFMNGSHEAVCQYCGLKNVFNPNSNIISAPTDGIIMNNGIITPASNGGNVMPPQPAVSNVPPQPTENKFIPPVNNNNTNNQTPKKKKKKKSGKKIFLYIFFTLLIIASGIVFYLDYTKEVKEPEIYDKLPSEIDTKEEELVESVIESKIFKLAPDVDFAHEREYYNNPDIIARLEIPELFNVLVVKGEDNSYYLSHSIRKEYDIRGTEFIDYRVYPTSQQVNVYGHNTRDPNIKVSFLKLEKYLDKTYFEENPYVILQYENGKDIYKIIAMKEITSQNNSHMYVDRSGADFVEHVRDMTTGDGVINSRNVAYDENSKIIVLQTCSHHWDDAFYIITAVRI